MDHSWRIDSPVPTVNVTNQACSLIKDPSTGRVNVLVSGGVTPGASHDVPTTATWLWDPVTDNIKSTNNLPSGSLVLNAISYTDYESLILSPTNKTIYSYTVNGGFQTLAPLPANLLEPIAMLVPKGLFHCI